VIKVGLVTDQTGPLWFSGIANANVARMVVADINARGGLLGQPIELLIEDGASDDRVAEAKARKLVQQDRVHVILGGLLSSTRHAIKKAAVLEGRTLYIYPEHYEGGESHPLIFCTGPVPAQQLEPFIPWLMHRTGAKRFYCPSADYIWPRVMNGKLREVAAAHGGTVVGEEYFPPDHTDYRATIDRIMSSGADVIFNTIIPPGIGAFLVQLQSAGFTQRGGQVVCTYFDENFVNIFPAALVEGFYTCLDYYQDVGDPFSRELLAKYDRHYPGGAKFTAGSASTGMYRGLRLWEAAVREAGSLRQDDVIQALDHARIEQGPGGAAEMAPGQHHVRMNMYIAQARNGRLEVLENLRIIDPEEAVVTV
jgi:branched-chain amino acid transport system substrate-binding protein